VTSKTAEAVLRSAGEHSARVYTVFESQLFASGASQISTLRRLAEQGHRIFHVARLHAKVVLTRKTATVGSQNLTGGGQHNRETTVVISDAALVKELRAGLRQWLATAERISIERIREMERSIGPVRRAFRKFQTDAKELDDAVAKQERARLRSVAHENRIRDEAQHQRAEDEQRVKRLRAMLEECEQSRFSVPLRVTYKPYETLVLQSPHVHDLMEWRMRDGRLVALNSRERYLLVSPTGRIAWPALNKTRLTQFGSGLTNGGIDFNGKPMHVAFAAMAAPRDGDANVELRLKVQEQDPPFVVAAWFDLAHVELRTMTPPEGNGGVGGQWLATQLEDRTDELMAELARLLLEPFRYAANRRGLRATQFLGTERRRFWMRLCVRGGSAFLALE
jgi:Sec-independent protein translocase protein TatA